MESEEILSNEERMAILGQVFKPKPKVNEQVGVKGPGSSTPPQGDAAKPNDSSKETSPSDLESFGDLLEKTLKKRQIMDKQEDDVTSKDREFAINESRKDLIGDMVKVFFRI